MPGSVSIRANIRHLASIVLVIGSVVLIVGGSRTASALSPTFGNVDSVTLNPDDTMKVVGWAATSDFPTVSLGVRVQIDGSYYTFPMTNFRRANVYRPDVGAAYPGYGDYHGFEFSVPVPNGLHMVCVEAQNSGFYNIIGSCLYIGASGRYTGRLWQQTQGQVRTTTFSRGTTWQSDIDAGALTWNAGAHLDVNAVAIGSQNVQFLVANYNSVLGVYAYGLTGFDTCPNIGSPCDISQPMSGPAFASATIWINSGHPDLLASQALRRKVTAHEMGHALGLFHPPNLQLPTVMGQGPIVGMVSGAPTSYDLESINNAYP